MIGGLSVLLAGTIVVRPAGPISTLTAALARASPNDTIVVEAGTYREPTIVVGLRVMILGHNQPIFDGGGDHTVFRVLADSVTIDGLLIRNVGPTSTEDRAAIRLEGTRGCVIRHNEIRDTFFGIYAAKAHGCRIEGNTVVGSGRTDAESGNAIHLWSSDGMSIIDNRVRGHRDGIYFEFVKASRIEGNESRGNRRYGLHFMFSDSCTYRRNVFRENGAGVAVMYTKRVTMTENRFEHNKGQAAYGLLLKDITDSRIDSNYFDHNTIGLYLEGSDHVTVRANQFDANGWALRVLANATENLFEHNTFTGNAFDVSTNSRSASSTFRENFWDHYRGFDLDRDGIGDVPFRPVRLFSLVVGQSAPALILLRSTFVDLLDAAERLLPILTPEALVDPRPLMAAPR
ncbi:MAG: nitrous oxide reductase family maturation protein NosD [Gemmatimonadota bacterium]